MGQQLAAGQFGDGQGVGQVQLKENIVAAVKSLLGPVRDEVPHSGVGHVDGAKQVRRRGGVRSRTFYSPQERVHLTLLSRREKRKGGSKVRSSFTGLKGTKVCRQ